MKKSGFLQIVVLFVSIATSFGVKASEYRCQILDRADFKINLEKDSLELYSGDTKIYENVKGCPTNRIIKGYNSTGKTLFGGLTKYLPSLGFSETYAGNGIEDGEAVFSVETSALLKFPDELEVELLSTGEEGELNAESAYCYRAN
jgi:hypothetical protein